MKKSFLNAKKPWLTAFLIEPELEDNIRLMKQAIKDGADSVAIEITRLKPEYWNENDLKTLFSAAGEKPIYSCCYRWGFGEGRGDEELSELSLLCAKCGSTLIDVMGDLYHPEPWQMTFDEEAVEKQKELIAQIHALGCEVLMSAHNGGFYPPEQIASWMKAQEERGADVAKDISVSDTEEQLLSALETFKLLNKELKIPYLFMTGGKYCYLTRELCGRLGGFMYLGKTSTEGVQPDLKTIKYMRDELTLI